MWFLRNPVKIEGTEFFNKRAIYISNHAYPIDIFLIMWLTPTGHCWHCKGRGEYYHCNLCILDLPKGFN
ncbi:hypothetical protein SLEP1_g57303 [Rubroshorea leprosula]|uniref:Phospholipid/glycerol acyltransferase domain-containing protein n=1 Tax=Rubroshorea leprosula TaxID=152421 RepID=A0AAV5ML94_9ROSI|nr:hypothetical protein SLEP1_g57303 [Rubroshorea leprosula]